MIKQFASTFSLLYLIWKVYAFMLKVLIVKAYIGIMLESKDFMDFANSVLVIQFT